MAIPPLRVCAVSFLNAWPLFKPLIKDRAFLSREFGDFFSVETDLPSRCAQKLTQGECDLALVPVGAYAEHPEWEIVPDIAIGCRGPVQTVILLSQCPFAQIQRIYVDSASRSSALLLRLLYAEASLQSPTGMLPEFIPAPHGQTGQRVQGHDAALVIGDAAFALAPHFDFVYDLGQLWYEKTGLPFVFAFWAARPGVLKKHHLQALTHARLLGLGKIHQFAQEYYNLQRCQPSAFEALPVQAYVHYLQHHIRFFLGPQEISGLTLFLQKIREHRLLPQSTGFSSQISRLHFAGPSSSHLDQFPLHATSIV